MSQSPNEIRNEKAACMLIKAFTSRFFEAYYCPSSEEAANKAVSLISEGSSIGWGGSMTIRDIGLIHLLHDSNFTLFDRDLAKTPDEKIEIQKKAMFCDYFLMSSNAISEDGQLVNVDGNGNRIAALLYGPKNVIVLAGMNKVVKTLPDALTRARTIAAPINAQRFQKPTPCFSTGICFDCKSPDSICNQILITRLCKPKGRIKIILIGESLGY